MRCDLARPSYGSTGEFVAHRGAEEQKACSQSIGGIKTTERPLAQRTCGSAAHGLTVCGCATRSVAPKRGAAGAGPADGRASAATASWAAPPLGIFRVAPHVLHEQRVRLRWPSNAIARLCGSNNRGYGAVPNAQIVILACPAHGRSAVPTSSNRGSRLPYSCEVARALQVTMSLGAAGAVRARSADRAGRLH